MNQSVLQKLVLVLIFGAVITSLFLQTVLWSVHALWVLDVDGKSVQELMQDMNASSRFVTPIVCAFGLSLIAFLLYRFANKQIAWGVLGLVSTVAIWSIFAGRSIQPVPAFQLAALYGGLLISYIVGHALALIWSWYRQRS